MSGLSLIGIMSCALPDCDLPVSQFPLKKNTLFASFGFVVVVVILGRFFLFVLCFVFSFSVIEVFCSQLLREIVIN